MTEFDMPNPYASMSDALLMYMVAWFGGGWLGVASYIASYALCNLYSTNKRYTE